MNAKSFIVMCVIISLLPNTLNGQQLDKLVPNVVPPSPDASAIGRYGNYPVSQYTGLPQISLPIYEIKSRDAELPITLSYHAAGVQVKEEASWVGLGWSLNAGGAVTRMIRGEDDFKVGGYWFNRWTMPQEPSANPLASPYPYMYFNGDVNLHVDMIDPTTGSTTNYYGQLTTSGTDWASDIYYVNCGKLNAKFLIDRSGTMRSLDHADIKIEQSMRKDENGVETTVMAGWKVTTDDGTQYFFGNDDYAIQSQLYDPYYQWSASHLVGKNVNGFAMAFQNLRTGQGNTAITSWFVKRIVFPTGEEIKFEYDKPQDLSRDIIAPIPDLDHYFIESASTYCENNYSPTEGRVSLSYNVHQAVYLSRISFTNGYITFNRVLGDMRQDLQGSQRLASIEVWSKKIGQEPGRSVRVFQLNNNDYFNTTIDGYGNYNSFFDNVVNGYINNAEFASSKRLRLNSVVESNGDLTRTHSFIYSTVELPKKTSFAVDYWGYFNGKMNPHLVPAVTWQEYTIYQQIGTGAPITPIIVQGTQYPGANRNADVNFAVAGILNKITFPTGGSTDFNYELNSFTESGTTVQGSGLRVTKIVDTDPETGRTETEVFKYQGGVQVTPIKNFMIRYCAYSRAISTGTILQPLGSGQQGWVTDLSPYLYRYSTSMYPMSNAAGGSPVGYSTVEHWQGLNAENGKTVFQFHNQPDVTMPFDTQGFMHWPGVPGLSDTQNGNLEMMTVYAKDAAQQTGFRKISSLQNFYVDLTTQWQNKTRFFWNMYVHITPSQIISGSASVGVWTYPVATSWNHLVRTEEKHIDDNGVESVSITKYNYHEALPAQTKHHQVRSKSTTDSDGTIQTSLYTYPADYITSAMGGKISDLQSNFMMNRLIEDRMIDGETTGKTISGSVHAYSSRGHRTSTHLLENTVPISNILTGTADIIPDANLFKERVTQTYDNYQNMLTYKKGDMPTSYIWGYNNTLPIASIDNITMFPPPSGPSFTSKTLSGAIDGNTTAPVPTFLVGTINVPVAQRITFSRTVQVISGSGPIYTVEVEIAQNGATWYSTVAGEEFSVDFPAGTHSFYLRISAMWSIEGYLDVRFDFDVMNSPNSGQDVFHTSFEESLTNTSSEAKTGRRSCSGLFFVPRPLNIGSYILTYWSKSSTPGGNWTLNQMPLTITAASTDISIGGPGLLIDEVRLLPLTAQMTTYTYDPLIGITSQMGVDHEVTYYEYDYFGRLKLIRDDDKNIVKTYNYHYKN